jgi:hypothetical protein
MDFIRFLPSFRFAQNLRLQVMSPPKHLAMTVLGMADLMSLIRSDHDQTRQHLKMPNILGVKRQLELTSSRGDQCISYQQPVT